MPFIGSIPEHSGPEGICARFPRSGRLLMELTEELIRGPSKLSIAERELIAAYTSELNACQLCSEGHSAAAEFLGVGKDLINSLVKDIETAKCTENMKPILRFVKKLTLAPSRIVQADVSAVLDAGWDEETFYCVVSICGLLNYLNRLVDGFGVKLSLEYREHVGEHLATRGYLSD